MSENRKDWNEERWFQLFTVEGIHEAYKSRDNPMYGSTEVMAARKFILRHESRRHYVLVILAALAAFASLMSLIVSWRG